ncbi:hypothetical protein F4808DRAFT_421995 [Astrocystis sublimbata]|nr:hypothetical protein F4808DRAFT_421995 [Astrocystis sublimbata]
MSDQSDPDDGFPSSAAGSSIGEDPDESETDQEGAFFDLEADDSHGDDEDGEDGEEDEYDAGHNYGGISKSCRAQWSFPQFSRLPSELRGLIWEAFDPYMQFKTRVLDFNIVEYGGNVELWETVELDEIIRPSRKLLATSAESRHIALLHYPHVIQLRNGRGQVRFNNNDIISLHMHRSAPTGDIFSVIQRCCHDAKQIAIDERLMSYSRSRELPLLDYLPTDLRTFFCCFEPDTLGRRRLEWSVSNSAKQFYSGIFEAGDEYFGSFWCWPDTTLHKDFRHQVGSEYMLQFEWMPDLGPIPVWPLASYGPFHDAGAYPRVKRYYEQRLNREDASDSSCESDLDEYALDGFVVDSSSEVEEDSDAEGSDVDVDEAQGSIGVIESSDEDEPVEDEPEENAKLDFDQDEFTGFSPLQDQSDDESTSNAVGATSAKPKHEDYASDSPSLEEQPLAAKQSIRRKRRIVSSDEEDGGNDDEGENAGPSNTRNRRTKRARLVVSDSEDDEGGSGSDASPGVKRAPNRIQSRRALLDSEDEETDTGEDEDEDQDEDQDEDGDEGDEERPRVTAPVSLFAKLTQFRSDVPVSPEGDSSISDEELDEDEQYGDEDERGSYDAEFPDSAGEEDGGQDGW